ncbi:hypothetical protein BGZ65_005844 [Modicella reniformis]|uniref:Uncharacterized protein n=1 Tax=Modicella reniformis TaxID=1440133 RepID=A0A9P6MBB9_9FUNG|nr:hypothetical protein BGZ65_005844 [Modicella reniformis]
MPPIIPKPIRCLRLAIAFIAIFNSALFVTVYLDNTANFPKSILYMEIVFNICAAIYYYFKRDAPEDYITVIRRLIFLTILPVAPHIYVAISVYKIAEGKSGNAVSLIAVSISLLSSALLYLEAIFSFKKQPQPEEREPSIHFYPEATGVAATAVAGEQCTILYTGTEAAVQLDDLPKYQRNAPLQPAMIIDMTNMDDVEPCVERSSTTEVPVYSPPSQQEQEQEHQHQQQQQQQQQQHQ